MGIINFLKKIGLLKAGTESYKGKDHKMVDDFHSGGCSCDHEEPENKQEE